MRRSLLRILDELARERAEEVRMIKALKMRRARIEALVAELEMALKRRMRPRQRAQALRLLAAARGQ